MARRADHSRQQLHDMALGAAREIVAAEGLRGLTARGVAREIGYTVGTIYNLFENLDDLIVHLNAATLDDLYAAVTARPVDPEPEAALRAYARRYMEFTSRTPLLWRAVFEHQLPDGVVRPAWYHPKVEQLLGLAEQALQPLFGAEQAAERAYHARVLWSALFGIGSLTQSDSLDDTTTPAGLIDQLITTYLTGLRGQSGTPERSHREPVRGARRTPGRRSSA